MEETWKKIKSAFKFIKILLPIIIIFIVIITILAAISYFLKLFDAAGGGSGGSSGGSATAGSSSTGNVLTDVKQYKENITVNDDGTLKGSSTIQEVWNELTKSNDRVKLYLKNSEEFARLIKAEIVTKFPDTRSNPYAPIDIESIKNTGDKIQGIVKFKRSNAEGKVTTMTYADPGTFWAKIEKYNNTGDETAKNYALSHFTLEKSQTQTTNSTNTQGAGKDYKADISDAIVDATGKVEWPGAGLCLGWVHKVYETAGVQSIIYKNSAYESYKACAISTDRENIPIGAAVYGTGVKVNGNSYGHVGIYIGEGKIIDSINSGIKTWNSIDEWIAGTNTDTIDGKTGWLGWGWLDGSTTRGTTESNESSDSGKENYTASGISKYTVAVATWNEITTTIETNDPNMTSSQSSEYHMTTTKVNYQEMTSKYTMPFDLLWQLLVISDDKDFVFELADLVYNSEIEVTVHDNLTVTTDTDAWTYDQENKTETYIDINLSYGQNMDEEFIRTKCISS